MSAYAGDRGHARPGIENPARGHGRLIAAALAAIAVALAALALVHVVAGSPATPPENSRSLALSASQIQRLPLPLRAQLSAAQGRAAGAYRVRTGPDGSLSARGGGIFSSFSRGGVSLGGPRGRASLALVGVSDAGAAVPLARTPARAKWEPRRLRRRRRRRVVRERPIRTRAGLHSRPRQAGRAERDRAGRGRRLQSAPRGGSGRARSRSSLRRADRR